MVPRVDPCHLFCGSHELRRDTDGVVAVDAQPLVVVIKAPPSAAAHGRCEVATPARGDLRGGLGGVVVVIIAGIAIADLASSVGDASRSSIANTAHLTACFPWVHPSTTWARRRAR